MAWRPAEAARVERGIIAPFEAWTCRLPPAEWAKWKADPEPDSGPMPTVSAADRQRGFVLYSRHYLACIYPHTRPRPEEMNPSVMYRYRIVPDILERFETLDLPAGETARFWLTVHVPDRAPAGLSAGKITFTCSGGTAEVPIRLRSSPAVREEQADSNTEDAEAARSTTEGIRRTGQDRVLLSSPVTFPLLFIRFR